MPSPLIESLETRTFLSIAPVTGGVPRVERHLPAIVAPLARVRRTGVQVLNVRNLLGLSAKQGSWTYNTTYALSGLKSASGSGSSTLTHTKRTYQGRPSDMLKASIANGSFMLNWNTDSAGTHLAAVASRSDLGSISLKLDDTAVAPATMMLGQTYTRSGRFAGTARITTTSFGGQTITGPLSGTSQSTSRLLRTATVTVPAGTFNAIEGYSRIRLVGTVTARYLGQTYTANFTAVHMMRFWAAAGVGIVKADQTATMNATARAIGSGSLQATAHSELTSASVA